MSQPKVLSAYQPLRNGCHTAHALDHHSSPSQGPSSLAWGGIPVGYIQLDSDKHTARQPQLQASSAGPPSPRASPEASKPAPSRKPLKVKIKFGTKTKPKGELGQPR